MRAKNTKHIDRMHFIHIQNRVWLKMAHMKLLLNVCKICRQLRGQNSCFHLAVRLKHLDTNGPDLGRVLPSLCQAQHSLN